MMFMLLLVVSPNDFYLDNEVQDDFDSINKIEDDMEIIDHLLQQLKQFFYLRNLEGKSLFKILSKATHRT